MRTTVVFGTSSEPIALQMPLERFQALWPRIAEQMDTVAPMWNVWWTKDYIYDATMSRALQVWGIGRDGEIRITAFTRLAQYPTGLALQVFLVLGNELDEFLDAMYAAFEHFGRELGCVRIEGVGRRGWERKLRKFGATTVTTMISYSINDHRVQ